MRGKKVLITGGAGFIGSNLAIHLVELGAQVCVADALLPDLGGNLFNLAPVLDSIRFENIDLRNKVAVFRLVKDFDIIFNLAGSVSHQDSMRAPLVDLSINTTAQFHLLEACRHKNPHAIIVYSGTRQIYGVPKYLPVDEHHPINPIDVNGINKLAAEQLHILYNRVYGMKIVSLRLTNTYGPRQLIRHARQGFVGWFLNRAITGNTIQLYGGGGGKRDFTYVDDVVDALVLTAQTQKCYGEVFNVNGPIATMEDIADTLVHLAGKGNVEKIPFPPEKKKIDIGDYFGNAEKISSFTGWIAKTTLQDGLNRMINYYKKHSAHYLGEKGDYASTVLRSTPSLSRTKKRA